MSEFDGFEDAPAGLPPAVEAEIVKQEKSLTEWVRKETGNQELVVEFDRTEVLTERAAGGERLPRTGESSRARSVSTRKRCQAYAPFGTRCKICGEVHKR